VPCYIITLGIHSAAVHFGNGAVLNLSQFSLDLPAMLLIPIISTGYIPKRKNFLFILLHLPAVCKYYNRYTRRFEMHINIGCV
jgi:hypothetical protein